MDTKSLLNKIAEEMIENDTVILIPVYNGHVVTYGVVDNLYKFTYDQLSNDLFGTPGRMDKRLFEIGRNYKEGESPNVVLLSSDFGEVPDKDIDFGDDDINYPLKTLNGEDGDPALVFHLNGFEETEEGNVFEKKFGPTNESSVKYTMENDFLTIYNKEDDLYFSGTVKGIEELRNICSCCKVPFQIWT